MAEPFLGEIRIVSFYFAPRNWATCDGQLLPIVQFQALYSLLGTTYGGDGRVSFGLPDLRGRTPMHRSSTHTYGQRAGSETHALSVDEMPAHQHATQGSDDNADSAQPDGRLLAHATQTVYGPPTNLTALDPQALSSSGSGAGHENMQPFLALNYVIAYQGIFPPRD